MSFVQKYYNFTCKNLTGSKYIIVSSEKNYELDAGIFALETKNNNLSNFPKTNNVIVNLNLISQIEKQVVPFRSVINKMGVKQIKIVSFEKNYAFSCSITKWIQNNSKTMSPRFRVFKLTNHFIKIISWYVFSTKPEYRGMYADTFSISLSLPIKKATFLSKIYRMQFLNLVKRS